MAFSPAGDTVDCIEAHDRQFYRILGRTSSDIIKSGGFKLSALQIENALLAHELVDDAAVVGIPDDTYGQVVACLVVLKPATGGSASGTIRAETALDAGGIRQWLGARLAPYEVPRLVRFVDEIPKNAMGKVQRRDLTTRFFP